MSHEHEHHDHEGHAHEHHGHEGHVHEHHGHEGHVHTHDIYTEDGVEPAVVSVTREIPGDAVSAVELAHRAERIVYTLTSVFSAKKILIGHIKLQLLAGEDSGLFLSATGLENITKTEEGLFGPGGASSFALYKLGLTVIVFGMPEERVESLVTGVVDGLLGSPV
ncbi:MAG: hypothetical protein LBC58_05015 [Clostridiales Family XIII bacterium]|jgi:hypothetical protein|nr:hypothetical protein [Clostridiales Family XIII bacterium]